MGSELDIVRMEKCRLSVRVSFSLELSGRVHVFCYPW